MTMNSKNMECDIREQTEKKKTRRRFFRKYAINDENNNYRVSNKKKKLFVPYEPYGELIYVIKSFLEIKEMMEVTSGEYIKEINVTERNCDVFNIKETSLTEWSDDEAEKISNKSEVDYNSSFTDICDEFSKFLSQDEEDISGIKEMSLTYDEDGSCVKETDLTSIDDIEIKETDLTEINDIYIKETDLTEIDDTYIKETDLTVINDTYIKETDLRGINVSADIKETDLTGASDNELDYLDIISNHSSELSRNNLINRVQSNVDCEQVNPLYIETVTTKQVHEFDVGDNMCDDGDIKLDDGDSTLLNKEQNMNGHGPKFQDIDTDYFETDYENESESKNYDHTKIKFQDLESDFFETDCETTEVDKNKPKGYFQDIESDFFDDDDSPTKESPMENRANDLPLINFAKAGAIKPIADKNKTAAMSNTLLRSTITELERALNDSNTLLAKRDQIIQDLRSRNNEMMRGLNRELDNSSQMKLLLLEKDAFLAEREAKVAELQIEIKNINTEIADLRLYKLNDVSNTDNNSSAENDEAVSSEATNLYAKRKSSKHKSESSIVRDHAPFNEGTSKDACKHKCRYKKKQLDAHMNRSVDSRCPPSEDILANSEYQNSSSSSSSSASCSSYASSSHIDDKISKTELHSNLRMKFMRDAFFYYMIGFHSDEQINAILAILDYGDKRQDFVLEAHKMKKLGKKFNVTKVSSRGLTFIQEEIK